MKHTLILVLLTLATVCALGCGISKESYDLATKEASDFKAQLSRAQTDLQTAQQSLTAYTSERDSLKVQLDKANGDLTTAQKNLSAVSADSESTKAQLNSLQASLTTAQQALSSVTSDRDSAKSQLDKAKADLVAAQQNLSVMTTERDSNKAQLDKAKTDLATSQTALTAAQQSFSNLNASVKKYQLYVDIATAYWEYQRQVHAGVDWDTMLQTSIPKIGAAVHATNDSDLIFAWDSDNELTFYILLLQRFTELKPKTS